MSSNRSSTSDIQKNLSDANAHIRKSSDPIAIPKSDKKEISFRSEAPFVHSYPRESQQLPKDFIALLEKQEAKEALESNTHGFRNK
ncbi:MAG: hypothetical protein P4M12_03515 [Gammaproteobacteria bacterium]|nr:hypothetical protein [Gammaproteobacteria bacterium]